MVYDEETGTCRIVVKGCSMGLLVADRRVIAVGQMTVDEALARRSTYRSAREAAKVGKYVGDTDEPPPYVDQWKQDYRDAVTTARDDGRTSGEYGVVDFKEFVRRMDKNAVPNSKAKRRWPASRSRAATANP